MSAYLIRRVLAVITVMFVVVTIVFLLIHLIPGDPAAAILGPDATTAQIEATRVQLGLDRPLHEQYAVFLARLAQGDLGTSVRTSEPVLDEVRARLPATLTLAVVSTGIAAVVGIAAGVLAVISVASFALLPGNTAKVSAAPTAGGAQVLFSGTLP